MEQRSKNDIIKDISINLQTIGHHFVTIKESEMEINNVMERLRALQVETDALELPKPYSEEALKPEIVV